MTIRERILLRIKTLGVKSVDVSTRVGIKPQNLSAYLKGNRTMPFEMLEKLCLVLGLTLGSIDNVYNQKSKECLEKK